MVSPKILALILIKTISLGHWWAQWYKAINLQNIKEMLRSRNRSKKWKNKGMKISNKFKEIKEVTKWSSPPSKSN